MLIISSRGSKDPNYRAAYIDGVLDFFSELNKVLENEEEGEAENGKKEKEDRKVCQDG